jgi:hypothetical protein
VHFILLTLSNSHMSDVDQLFDRIDELEELLEDQKRARKFLESALSIKPSLKTQETLTIPVENDVWSFVEISLPPISHDSLTAILKDLTTAVSDIYFFENKREILLSLNTEKLRVGDSEYLCQILLKLKLMLEFTRGFRSLRNLEVEGFPAIAITAASRYSPHPADMTCLIEQGIGSTFLPISIKLNVERRPKTSLRASARSGSDTESVKLHRIFTIAGVSRKLMSFRHILSCK